MSKLFEYCTELAEKKVEEIMEEFRAKKINKRWTKCYKMKTLEFVC